MAMSYQWSKPWAAEQFIQATVVLKKYGVKTVIELFPMTVR